MPHGLVATRWASSGRTSPTQCWSEPRASFCSQTPFPLSFLISLLDGQFSMRKKPQVLETSPVLSSWGSTVVRVTGQHGEHGEGTRITRTKEVVELPHSCPRNTEETFVHPSHPLVISRALLVIDKQPGGTGEQMSATVLVEMPP